MVKRIETAQTLLHPECMNPSEIRDQLLQEHDQLRVLVRTAQDAAHRLLMGTDDLAPFRLALTELRSAFAGHNISEEELLGPLLSDADEWGPVRFRRMIEEHVGEHCAMRAALVGDDLDIAPRMADLAEQLLAHMDAEERTILHPVVFATPSSRAARRASPRRARRGA